MPQSKPVIGVTLDREDAGGYSNVPWYALRENYCQSLSDLGATVIALPADGSSVEAYLKICDGIVISGGGFDIDPAMFGAETVHESVKLKPLRTDFEAALVKGAVAIDKPVLGICGGEQLMAALFGGLLYQHIPDEVENALDHSPSGDLHNPSALEEAHTVSVKPGSLLHQICEKEELSVNSSHHQAMKNENVPTPLMVNALAPDGVVEGIELRSATFCLGVQWHPEYLRTNDDKKILAAFVEACRQ